MDEQNQKKKCLLLLIVMEDVEENDNNENSSSLSPETQAFELELIKTYEQLPLLWDINHSDYTNKYRREAAVDVLLKIMKKWNSKATRGTVRQKINILRSCYRKDLRKRFASKTIGPDGGEIYEYTPKNWKFQALSFLGGKESDIERIKNNNVEEINLDSTNFKVLSSEESTQDESYICDIPQVSENKIFDQNLKKKTKRKRIKLKVHDYHIDDDAFNREFNAIASNVICKLKRMNPEQRCHAELLIGKVLIEGLKNNLTDDTNLTELYK